MIGRSTLALLVLTVLLRPPAQTTFAPQNSDGKPYWKGCEDMPPVSKDEDDTKYLLCTDNKGKQWEIVDRKLSRACHEIVRADKRDDYQHFDCTENFELMIRAHKKEGK